MMKYDESVVDSILKSHPGRADELVQVLLDIQSAFNYLPPEALRDVSGALQVPMSKVYSTASFYKALSLKPRGKNIIRVCMGTACHVRGSALILDEFARALGIKEGETTSDMEFTLESVNCVGACAMAPVVVVNDKYHGAFKPSDVGKLLKK
jgi:NADH-quinone oxidoreductase subunit E